MNSDTVVRAGEARWLALWGAWTFEELRQLSKLQQPDRLMRVWLETPDREGVRVIVRNQRGQVLMQHRTHDAPTNPGRWTAPGGRLKPREDPYPAACRELAEETGLRAQSLTPLGVLGFTALHDGAWVLHHLYTTEVTDTEGDLVLGQGQALQFLHWTELAQLDISPSARNALALAWLAAPTPSSHPTNDPTKPVIGAADENPVTAPATANDQAAD